MNKEQSIIIYKTTECGACKNLISMLGDKLPYEVINIEQIPKSEIPVMNGAPTVYVDGVMLDNPFALMELI